MIDRTHAPSLAYDICTAFAEVAKEHGVRLEGIEEDINEWSDFFRKVADRMIANNPQHPTGGTE